MDRRTFGAAVVATTVAPIGEASTLTKYAAIAPSTVPTVARSGVSVATLFERMKAKLANPAGAASLNKCWLCYVIARGGRTNDDGVPIPPSNEEETRKCFAVGLERTRNYPTIGVGDTEHIQMIVDEDYNLLDVDLVSREQPAVVKVGEKEVWESPVQVSDDA